ncbi:MAG: 3D domain-containing protein [Lachnospiraceae bacterium]|nr:3D domain-containing protein [Lachnospiraceae bacterium]
MKKLIVFLLIVMCVNNTAYAKEIRLINKTNFIECSEATTLKCKNEYVTEIKDIFVGEFIITAYCPCSICCGEYSNPSNPKTASGAIATSNHTIAADIDILPFRTKVIINGQVYVVEDVGGGVTGNHIDMFFDSHSEALNFGKKIEKVYTQEEVVRVLKPVDFREYILITGDLMKRKIAESYYDKDSGNVTWKNRIGNILATRKKNRDGLYENRVDENVYDEWKRER